MATTLEASVVMVGGDTANGCTVTVAALLVTEPTALVTMQRNDRTPRAGSVDCVVYVSDDPTAPTILTPWRCHWYLPVQPHPKHKGVEITCTYK